MLPSGIKRLPVRLFICHALTVEIELSMCRRIDMSRCRLAVVIVPIDALRQRAAMTWLVEIIVEGFWQGAVEAANRKWGWLAAVAVLFSPFAIGGLLLWMVLG